MNKPLFRGHMEICVHLLVWIYLFASPLLFKRPGENIDVLHYLQRAFYPLLVCAVFYINYLFLVPRYLKHGRYLAFVSFNLALIALAAGLHRYSFQFFPPFPRRLRHHHPPGPWRSVLFVMRSAFTFAGVVCTAIAVRYSLAWRQAEDARRTAELERTEAELRNLKNQINPHFLLNTLNNIYALTLIDAPRAGEAIQELGRMLRYMLYDSQDDRVPLQKEIDFIETYIELMRMRLRKDVDVRFETRIPRPETLFVAPLLFISLIENAFKHGVSPTRPSFVHISLSLEEGKICLDVRNSNHPKTSADKAGSGIGLQNVQSRLPLCYPDGRHSWQHGLTADGLTYRSRLVLQPQSCPI
ncbi:MAG: sensor histidine kinase [Prevotellaceae bacterium]|nr:sensor histidine kinase [Prevotellaceae bacterium]